MEGWLTKLGHGSGKWQRRYFTLNGAEITYASQPGGSIKGTITIDSATHAAAVQQGDTVKESAVASTAAPDMTKISGKSNKSGGAVRPFYLIASMDQERQAWIDAVNKAAAADSEEPPASEQALSGTVEPGIDIADALGGSSGLTGGLSAASSSPTKTGIAEKTSEDAGTADDVDDAEWLMKQMSKTEIITSVEAGDNSTAPAAVETDIEPLATTASAATGLEASSSIEHEFPLRSVSLVYCSELLADIEDTWTARDVKRNIVLPRTATTKSSLARTLPDGVAGQANVFVSHAWSYKFHDLVAALVHWATSRNRDQATTYVWIDVLSVSQHLSLDVTQEWWSTVFAEGIRNTGEVVLVIDAWTAPVPYTRAWCLWEAFNAHKTGAKFDIALPPREEESLADAIAKDASEVLPTLCKIEAAHATSSRIEDQQNIFKAIEDSCGFSALNGLVINMMREWLGEVVLKAMQQRAPDSTGLSKDQILFRVNVALLLRDLGQLHKSLEIAQTALSGANALLGENDSFTLETTCLLCSIQHLLGENEATYSLAQKSLKLHEEVFGKEHSSTLTQKTLLASVSGALGKLQEACDLNREVLKAREKELGRSHVDTMTAMNNLANTYSLLGDLHEAQQLTKEVLALQEEHLGHDHPDTLTSRASLGTSCVRLGEYDLALPLLKSTYDIYTAKLGPTHHSTLNIMNTLASLYDHLERHDDSLQLQQQVVESHTALYGERHADTLRFMNTLAECYRQRKQLGLAVPLHEKTLKLRQEVLGPHHPSTLSSTNNLAVAYADSGRAEEALKMQEQVLEATISSLGEDHVSTLTRKNNLGLSYSNIGRYDEALRLQQAAFDGRSAQLGSNHKSTLISAFNLALTHYHLADYEASVTLLEPAFHAGVDSLGRTHGVTDTIHGQLCEGLTQWIQALEVKHGPEHPEVIATKQRLEGLQA